MHFPKLKLDNSNNIRTKERGEKNRSLLFYYYHKGKRSIDKAVQTHYYYFPKLKGIFQLLFFSRKKKNKKRLRIGTHKQKERESGGIDWISNAATHTQKKKRHKNLFQEETIIIKKRNDKSSSSPGVGQSEQNEAGKRREQKRQQDLSKQKSNRPR